MSQQEKMIEAASGALQDVLEINAQDNFLILTDTHCKSIAEAFKQAAINKGCKVEKFEIDESTRPLKDVPKELEKLLTGKTVVLNILKAFAEELPFRIKWIFKVEENKQIRMGHMPGITEQMMLDSVNVNYQEMRSKADSLRKLLDNAGQLHITTEEGTDVMLGIKNRTFVSDVGVKPGEMCNLPCGEIYCAPLEKEANGIVVFNASVGDIGILDTPLKAYLENGRVIKFDSEDEKLVEKISRLQNIDEDSMVIGELGIGINPKARITGNMLEDEKVIGTAHIAFGNNADFPGGGNNRSKIHRDYLFYRPTIEVKYFEGTKKLIMKNGKVDL